MPGGFLFLGDSAGDYGEIAMRDSAHAGSTTNPEEGVSSAVCFKSTKEVASFGFRGSRAKR